MIVVSFYSCLLKTKRIRIKALRMNQMNIITIILFDIDKFIGRTSNKTKELQGSQTVQESIFDFLFSIFVMVLRK